MADDLAEIAFSILASTTALVAVVGGTTLIAAIILGA
jgi:hypothetical protein